VFAFGLVKKFPEFNATQIQKNHRYSRAYKELLKTVNELMLQTSMPSLAFGPFFVIIV
jgi:hypothetical protein